jgi:hypothetical protein
MKLASLLLLSPALLAAALPAPSSDVYSNIEAREAGPFAEAEVLHYIKREAEAEPEPEPEPEPLLYIKRTGYNPGSLPYGGFESSEKREASAEAEAEAEPLLYIKRAGYNPGSLPYGGFGSSEKREA